jgi:hypothetical protein
MRTPRVAGAPHKGARLGARYQRTDGNACGPRTDSQSGREDSNPRPVAAATALTNESREFFPATAGLKESLSLDSVASRCKFLEMDEDPRYAVLRGLRLTRIVAQQSIVQVLARPNVPTSCIFTAKHISEEAHSRGERIRTSDLLVPNQAL